MKVVIVDDSRVVVERLSSLLKEMPGVELVGRAGDAAEAMQCIRQVNGSRNSGLPDSRRHGAGRSLARFVPSPCPRYKEECLKSRRE